MASISFGLIFGGTPSISITSAVSLSLFELPAGGSSDGRLAELKGEDDIVNTTHGQCFRFAFGSFCLSSGTYFLPLRTVISTWSSSMDTLYVL